MSSGYSKFVPPSSSLPDPSAGAIGQPLSLELDQQEEHDDDYFHPDERRCPVKITLIAVLLLLTGLGCTIIGIVHFATGFGSSFAFFLIGAILILPGSYVCFQLIQAWRGIHGYSFAQIARL